MSSNSNNTPLTAQEARVLELIDGHLRLMHHINTHPRAPLRERGQQATAAAAQPTVWHRGQALNQHQQRLLGLFTQQSETPVAQQPVARRVSYNEIHQRVLLQHQQDLENPAAQQPVARRVSYNEIHQRVLLQHQQYLENPAAPQPTYDDPQAEALYQYLQQESNHNPFQAEARYQIILQQARPSNQPAYDDPAAEALFQGLVRRASEFS
ncbi:hypothetical protein BCIN_16g02420 [Botrytis cinerea B05.10]|uniref:Uncharacterized protein n=3 Tax=Botryotinia fuckeliana TaxID=40559 RepID=A0A384K6L4_BOTFB|nr:hypothetical protein BCIN_16g02420 [Botrytis cinerea B05.10]ATZ58466.1 hypothetical protein BCIN_16g02420 [Botrytis cinerea B05.10]EMR84748.1 hypothetical protein BcDW1_6604 [Botrytis cinerea BcDW1]CCD48692.1 hypothetical protein BofuT4_P033340.1 [Botrytis cinerea T4]